MAIKPFPFNWMISEDVKLNRLNAWQIFAHEFDNDIKDIVNFVKDVPRLNSIKRDDIGVLLKKNVFVMYLLRIVRALSPKGLVLRDGRHIDFDSLKLIFGELADDMLHFAMHVVSVGFTDSELAVFIVFMLVQPLTADYQAATRFSSTAQLVNIYEYFRKVLYKMMSSSNNTLERFQSLMSILPVLNRLNAQHEKIINDVIRANESFLSLPELFREIFRLPLSVTSHYNQENQFQPAAQLAIPC
uniref:NR LBD domain-containing protein n=1 Tax=Caenorhabditis tropicalis TaxID=1561998 RepID=A0A1I7U0Q9_9PELO